MKYKYAFFDGDNVGNTIEILLLDGKILEAQALSNNINAAIQQIIKFLNGKAEVILAGGDDILIKIMDDINMETTIKTISQMFLDITSLTISVGVDENIKGAIYQLYIAKLYGKNQIKISNKE